MEQRNTKRKRREGKRKDRAEEGLSGEFKERATERGEFTQSQHERNKE